LSEIVSAVGLRRPNGALLASVPKGGSGDSTSWVYEVYAEDGRTEVARVSVTTDSHGKRRVSKVIWNPNASDKLEWWLNPLGVAYAELRWSEAANRWEQNQFIRELGHAPYRKLVQGLE
jgi:hypothetical protein